MIGKRLLGFGLGAIVVGLAGFLAAAELNAQMPATADAGWLTGCWEQRTGDLVIEERWMPPRGGILLGISRTTRGADPAGFEFIRIFDRGGALVYAASPSGQEPTEFVSVPSADRELVFENLAHDFPQRVRYRAVGADSLYARIEGMRGGGLRGVDFPYARVACE